MKTFELLEKELSSVPLYTSMLLSDLGEAKGKQDLYIRQSPQALKSLKDFAVIESAVSSNRIEGVEVDKKRVGTVVFGKSKITDRNEEEVRGYKNALTKILAAPEKLKIDERTILLLHKIIRGDIGDAGLYKEKNSDIIETYPDGRSRTRFKTVSAKETPEYMRRLIEKYNESINDKKIPALAAITAFNLDFLCIHPFRDGNGRVSRLLFLLQLLQSGFEVGRYISLERIIENNKDRYYETLEKSSDKWHEGKHNPWHYANYLFYILKKAYKEIEECSESFNGKRGTKKEMIIGAVKNQEGLFSVSDLKSLCIDVGIDMIRKVMKDLQKEKRIICVSSGRDAKWEKTEDFSN